MALTKKLNEKGKRIDLSYLRVRYRMLYYISHHFPYLQRPEAVVLNYDVTNKSFGQEAGEAISSRHVSLRVAE